ncbi:MAG: c-type cytochrome [Bryobacteraceae bacterium]
MSRLLLASLFVFTASAFAAPSILGDARRGEGLFEKQKCIVCHSINGAGGKTGPDLSRRGGRDYTPALLASLMWNHAPVMWSAMAQAGIERPALAPEDVSDLFAYFYAARFFDRAGDAGRGKQAFAARKCSACHGLAAAIPGGARPVAEWESLADPIALASNMWNHAGQMQQAARAKKVRLPVLTSRELTDMLVYLENTREVKNRRTAITLAFGPEEQGQALYRQKGCPSCHRGGMSLESGFAGRSLTDFAVAMWNHAPKMKGEITPLSTNEMRRILSYLWASQLADEGGNPTRGQRVFGRKNCTVCHNDSSSGAPDLRNPGTKPSALSMVSALWRHGPAMQQRMRQRNIEWPRFEGPDMADLLAYLNGKR